LSKKKQQKYYVVETDSMVDILNEWAAVETLLHDPDMKAHGVHVIGGYTSLDEAEAVKKVRSEAIKNNTHSSPPVSYSASPYFTGEMSGRHFDIFVEGVYKGYKFGGAFAAYDGDALVHEQAYNKPSNQVKGSGRWGGLFCAIPSGLEWAKANGAEGVLIHLCQRGPAEWAAGVWKANAKSTQNFVSWMAPFKKMVKFAPLPEEAETEDPMTTERFKVVLALANRAAGII